MGEWISLLVWVIVVLAVSWVLGSIFIDQIGLPIKYYHLENNPLIILLVGFVALILLCIVIIVSI